MGIKRYIANKDNTITNAFKADLRTRGTGSNMGESDILEVFSISAQEHSASCELARTLVEFPVDTIITDRNAGDLPASGSVNFYLRMYNAKHSATLPKNFTLVAAAVSQSWEEGTGLDMEEYSDLTYDGIGSNWVTRASGSKWGNVQATATITALSKTAGQANTRRLLVTDVEGNSVNFNIDNSTSTNSATTIAFGNANSNATQFATNIAAAINAADTADTLNISATSDGATVSLTMNTANSTDVADISGTSVTDSVVTVTKQFTIGSKVTMGGKYHASPQFQQTFTRGHEDLEMDITHLVEEWVTGENFGEGGSNRKMNNGIGIYLTSSQEAEAKIGVSNAVIQNLTGSKQSYYTKKFFARGSEFFFKRPCIEARWDSTVKDESSNFKFWSPLAENADNMNTIYFYNIINGQLKNISTDYLTNNKILVSLYSGSHDGSRPQGSALLLKSSSYSALGHTPVAATNNTNATGGLTTTTGIYSCSLAITGANVSGTLTNMFAVWHNIGFGGSTGRYQFHTSSVFVAPRKASVVNDQPSYVTAVTNLRPSYHKNENARFRFYVREKNWNPNIFVKATSEPEASVIEDAYFRISRVADDHTVIDYGTGSANNDYSRLSYDVSGNYFDLDMSLLQPDYAYGINLVYYINGAYVEQTEKFKFRVEES